MGLQCSQGCYRRMYGVRVDYGADGGFVGSGDVEL